MLVPERHYSWLRLLVKYRGTALQRIRLRLFFTTTVALAVTVVDLRFGFFHPDFTTIPFTLIGVAVSIFLGFRNNTSYDRFWEGRRLWGQLVNTSRSFTRQILTLTGPRPFEDTETVSVADPNEINAFRQEMVYRLIAFVHGFRMHLRDQDRLDELRAFLPAAEVEALRTEINRPTAILQRIGDRLRDAWHRGWIHSMHMPVLEQSMTALTDIQGGCERIKNTPIPMSYTTLIHQIVAIYCLTLPFGIVKSVGQITPFVVALVSYAFFGLDAVGDEIEQPFGLDANDFPLSALSRMIEVNLRQRLGEKELPPLAQPKNGILR
ncbi:MAG: bestrophin family ion channel [Minicystis sp.]